MTTICRSAWVVLAVSSAVELLVVARPSFEGLGPNLRLFGDLALQSVLLFAVPAAVAKVVLRWRLTEVGLTLAGTRKWFRCWVPLFTIAWLFALLCTRIPSVHRTYPLWAAARSCPWCLALSTIVFAVYGLAWEFFFRGFVLFGLARKFGGWAIVIQAVPCALMHWGKPDSELLAALPAAIFLGIMALRSRSIVPGLVLHVSVALCVNLGCLFWPLSYGQFPHDEQQKMKIDWQPDLRPLHPQVPCSNQLLGPGARQWPQPNGHRDQGHCRDEATDEPEP
jgi:membrane protease YdiL (CAAX protease family)